MQNMIEIRKIRILNIYVAVCQVSKTTSSCNYPYICVLNVLAILWACQKISVFVTGLLNI